MLSLWTRRRVCSTHSSRFLTLYQSKSLQPWAPNLEDSKTPPVSAKLKIEPTEGHGYLAKFDQSLILVVITDVK